MTLTSVKPPIRIIPRLDIKGPNLVKGVHLEGLRVLGEPDLFARYYYSNGADELIYQDAVASLYERNSLEEFIEKTAENVFIPLTVGGGIRSLDNIKCILRSGADKVSINTAAVKRPEFIKEATEHFGSSTIVVSMEVIQQKNGNYLLFTDNGREHTGINLFEWIDTVQNHGAGEILLTSVDKEGTCKGMDTCLINDVLARVNLPLICHGGVGVLEHIEFASRTNISGLAIASAFHYNYLAKYNNSTVDKLEGNTDFIKKNKFRNEHFSIIELKRFMIEGGMNVRDS
jgi:imidazole glycerol-phosphate synthase subunit HisF